MQPIAAARLWLTHALAHREDMKKSVCGGVKAVLICCLAAAIFGGCSGSLLHLSTNEIERHLLIATPLGSTEAEVLSYLQDKHISGSIKRAHVRPGVDYPPTAVEGNSFIHESIGEYGLLFQTSVEAFWVFNSAGRLVDLKVRKTTDAL